MVPLSVVIATFNRRPVLEKTLGALRRQTHRDFRILVIDDGSTDGTWEWLKENARRKETPTLEVMRQENRGQGQARNHALRYVAEGLVLFLGDDILLGENTVAEHVAAHESLPGEKGYGGPIAVVGFTDWCRGEMKVTPLLEMINTEGHQFGYRHMAPGAEVPFTCFYTSNVSLPRDVLGRDPFDSAFLAYGWEDIELAFRLCERGLRLYYQPSAAAEHLHPMDLTFVYRRQRLVGRGYKTLLELHPSLEGNPLFSPPEPPRWFFLGKRLIPPSLRFLNALDQWHVPLPKALLHRVLLCAYYQGREATS